MQVQAKKSVGVFVGSYLPYSETFILEQLKNHQRFAPTVFAYETLEDLEQVPSAPVQSLTKAEKMLYLTLGTSRKFDATMRKAAPDVLHAHFGTNGTYATAFSKRHRVPLMVTFHGHDVPALIGRSRLRPRYVRYALLASQMMKRAKVLHACSKDLADRLICEVGAPASKVEVLHLGVDLRRFKISPTRTESRKVVMVGRFVSKKGHLYGLRAFAAAASKFDDAQLVLIGDGALRERYLREIRALGIESKVTLTGAVPSSEVRKHLESASVLLCPSVTAPNGDVESGVIVVKEAAACGVPTIGSIHGGIPEIVVDGETGFLAAERDVKSLTSSLERLFADPSAAMAMGVAARARAEKHFDLTAQVAKLEDLYDRAG